MAIRELRLTTPYTVDVTTNLKTTVNKDKIELTQIDKENWRFVLYESKEKKWIGDFVYSPISFVDLSMLIVLTNQEKLKAEQNRQFLIELSEKIRNDFNRFLSRAENRNDYVFIKRQI